MSQMIIETQELVKQIYHSEDGNLRTEGLWPEYAHTMSICVDSYRDGVAFGRIHCYYFEGERHLCTLDQILFVLEEILDEAGVPGEYCKVRNEILTREQIQRRGNSWHEIKAYQRNAPTRRVPFYPMDGLYVKTGSVANFRIRLLSRCHCSMQGTISMDRNGHSEATAFRSALELLHLIYSSLEEATR